MKTFKNISEVFLSHESGRKSDICKAAFGLILLCVLLVGFYHIGRWGISTVKYYYHAYLLDDMYDAYNEKISLSGNYCFFENGPHSYIMDTRSEKKVLTDIRWIMQPRDDRDSLLCFAHQGYRGYWNLNTGKVTIPADRYKKAWVFSEGMAAVMEKDSTLKFIDPNGKIVIDKAFKYMATVGKEEFLFHNGYSPMIGENHLWGFIDKRGEWVVAPSYNGIWSTGEDSWICQKSDYLGLLDDSLRVVISPDNLEIAVTERGIEVLKKDYTRQLVDFDGSILEKFMVTNLRSLCYKAEVADSNAGEYKYALSSYMEYQTTASAALPRRVGLLSPAGIPVTPPVYSTIEAINAECFRCYYDVASQEDRGTSVIVNKNGKVIDR